MIRQTISSFSEEPAYPRKADIPDFRSVDGLYHQNTTIRRETILSHTFYRERPEEFFRFYRDKMLYLDAQPNAAHKKLAQWEREGKLKAVVTQNIDGLHQKAGRQERAGASWKRSAQLLRALP